MHTMCSLLTLVKGIPGSLAKSINMIWSDGSLVPGHLQVMRIFKHSVNNY